MDIVDAVFDKEDRYKGFRYGYSVYGNKSEGYSAKAVITIDFGDLIEQREYFLKKKDYSSKAEAESAIQVGCQKIIDDF